ncbi:hypothetical protein ACKFKF_32730 [Phormidesmis sp. 146-12]
MDNYLTILKKEFEAEEGSFLIQLRPDLTWNKAAFARLTLVMQACCEEYSQTATLDRWIAQGFWYIPSFVRDWTTHPNFPQIHTPEYYEQSYQELDDLAYWFFMGESLYNNDI